MATSGPTHQFTELIQELLVKCEEFEMVYRKPTDTAGDGAKVECSLSFTLSDGEEAARVVSGAPSGRSVAEIDEFGGGSTEIPDVTEVNGHLSTASSGESRSDPRSFTCPHRDCNREFESKHGRRIHHSKAHQPSEVKQQSAPGDGVLYKNPEVLREIYDEDESFAEMAAKLDSDVSGSTIRRHMINFGIHEPTTYDTANRTQSAPTDEEDEQDETMTNTGSRQLDTALERMLVEIGVDPSLSVEELTNAIVESETLHETSNRLEQNLDQTRELLLRMDVVDAVFGRLDDKERHDVPSDEVEARIKENLSQAPAM